MVNCKVCRQETNMEGTRLCNGCWEGLRSGDRMIRALHCDVQVSYEHFVSFPWSVSLRSATGESTVTGKGQSLEEALEKVIVKRGTP